MTVPPTSAEADEFDLTLANKDCPIFGQQCQDDIDDLLTAGCRPLHVACGQGRVDIVNFLLCNNAAVNVKTVENSLTPLQVIAYLPN
jgi:ankyrin repeat protein